MEELDLRTIWQQGRERESELPSVLEAARRQRRQSLNLVERIKRTAQTEHRIFLIAAGCGVIALLLFSRYFWALGLVVFAALMIWKYEAEMRLFKAIKPENTTLEYLRSVSRLLDRFLRNYRIGFYIFIPLVVLGGALLGQWIARGTLSWELWQRPMMWLYLLLGMAAGILFSRWWLKIWVHTLYGRKLMAMQQMMQELEEA